MINIENIKRQCELAKSAVSEIKKQNRIFETLMHEAIKGAPEEHKKDIQRIQVLATKAINLAKQGKSEEAQNLIKDFQNGSTNN